MVDVAVEFLVEALLTKIVSEVSQALAFHRHFLTLKKHLEFMRDYLIDVDMLKIKEQKQALKTVTRQVKELLYDAENIVEDCELFLSRQRESKCMTFLSPRQRESKCMTFLSPTYLLTRCQMGKKIREINKEISKHRDSMMTYPGILPKLELDNSRLVKYPVLLDETEIVGLERDVEKIKKWIMETQDYPRVVGIVGMGGIGKSTLAQKLQNDSKVKEFFQQVVFVRVFKTFQFEFLLKDMLKKLNASKESSVMSVENLIQEVKNELKGKKYLVILDDVWQTDEGSWWESLKSALPKKRPGGSIIVTTRNERVAQSMGALDKHMHRPEGLSSDHSWSVFKQIALANKGGQCPNSEIETIGKEIALQCRGLPLALKVVGGVVLGKPTSIVQWKRIANHLKDELAAQNKDDEIFLRLKLSYDELPAHLRPCMLSFSAFPENYEIHSIEVIHWWIGEGFIREDASRTGYEIGEEYVDELVSRCLLLGGIKDVYERRYNTFRVHDMIREMIAKIAKEDGFMRQDDIGQQPSIERFRRAGIVGSKNMHHLDETGSQDFRTIIGRYISENEGEFVQDFGPRLCQLQRLRVFDISFRRAKSSGVDHLAPTWLSGLRPMHHLICFQIVKSGVTTLPDCIGKLPNLQILSLIDCTHLTQLPLQVTSLKKLTMLELDGCESLKHFPVGLGNLANLQSLLGFKPAATNIKDGCHFSELKMLTQLRRLDVLIDSESQLEEGSLEVLSEIKQLKILVLSFGNVGTGRITRKVDYELLHPIQCLEDLRLNNFPGDRTPAWLNPGTLPNLHFLHIHQGSIRGVRSSFYAQGGNMTWKLEVLQLSFLDDLEESWPKMQQAMPFLQRLRVVGCGKLKSLPFDVAKGGGTWRKEDDMLGGPSQLREPEFHALEQKN